MFGKIARPESSAPAWTGQNCSILLTDIAGFSAPTRTAEDRWVIRRVMYEVVKAACDKAGITWSDCHHEDRGDGVLIVIPPSLPTSLIVDPLLTHLAAGLADHNRRAAAFVRIQLRVALHVGPVITDAEGVTGDAIIYAVRLLDAQTFKRGLRETSAEVGVITSEFVYDTFVKQAPGNAEPDGYRRVNVRVKESRIKAWMRCTSPAPQKS